MLLPFRIDTDESNVPIVAWRLEVEVDGQSWSSRARMRRIRDGFADWMRGQMQTHGRDVAVDLTERADVGSARVVFVNFAIQGLNDLFATADDDYTPPRTYAQVTMRDPGASYSSRPGSKESRSGDGYAFTLEAHRRYGVPQMWAMNGGLLDLLAHDCPGDLEQMRQDVRDGLLVPVVAGFGAHRLPYYTTATNLDYRRPRRLRLRR